METGVLLEKLINIAQISKTDFAVSMNMTPSGLSKILAGKRMPPFKEKKAFCKKASNYFAEAIYDLRCYLKFEDIFPVIYDFSSKYELEAFLECALEYALDQAFSVENNIKLEYSDSGTSFLGKKMILNMFCVIISDAIMNKDAALLELYSTLPLFNRFYTDIFHRIKIVNCKSAKEISFNHFFDMASFETSYDEYNMNTIFSIVEAQKYVDLNLWKITKEINSSFLLLKGKFLLLFTIQLDGTPLMTFVTQRVYLTTFFNALMKKEAKKISYNQKEARELLETDPSLMDQLVHRNIDAVYNFISIGYLIEKGDLENVECEETIKNSVLRLFKEVLTKETTCFVTIDAMMGILATGKAFVPLIGAIDIPPNERISYLKRFDSYINEESSAKIKIVNNEMPKVAVLCSCGLSLVYLMDHEYKSEKIHYFETDTINHILDSEVAQSAKTIMDFSSDLWTTYIDEVSITKIHTR